MRTPFLAVLAVTIATSHGDSNREGTIDNTCLGTVRFGEAYDGEAVYICSTNLTIEDGIPTIRVPFATTVQAEIALINGYNSDILLLVAPQSEVLLPPSSPRLWFDGTVENRWIKNRGSGSGMFRHHRNYESIMGIGPDRPPTGTKLLPCCCMAKTFAWEGRLDGTAYAAAHLSQITKAEFTQPIRLHYVVIGRTNVFEIETNIRIIAEKEQPTSGSSEPSQSSGH